MAHDIFLSYSRKDSVMKDRVKQTLEDAGLRVWTDEHLTPYTRAWEWAIEEAIEECKCFVVLLSPTSNKSTWVLSEITSAEERGKLINSILIDAEEGKEYAAIPLRLKTYQRLDVRDMMRYEDE